MAPGGSRLETPGTSTVQAAASMWPISKEIRMRTTELAVSSR